MFSNSPQEQVFQIINNQPLIQKTPSKSQLLQIQNVRPERSRIFDSPIHRNTKLQIQPLFSPQVIQHVPPIANQPIIVTQKTIQVQPKDIEKQQLIKEKENNQILTTIKRELEKRIDDLEQELAGIRMNSISFDKEKLIDNFVLLNAEIERISYAYMEKDNDFQQLEGINLELSQDIQILKQKLDGSEKRIVQIEIEYQQSKKQNEDQLIELKMLKSQLIEIQRKNKELIDNIKDRDTKINYQSNLNQKVDEIQLNMQQLLQDNKKLNDINNLRLTECETLKKMIRDLEFEKQTEIANFNNDLQKINSNKNDKEMEIIRLQEQIKSVQKEKSILENQIKILIQENEVVSQALSSAQKHYEKVNSSSVQFKSEKEMIEGQLLSKQERINQLEQIVNSLRIENEKLQQFNFEKIQEIEHKNNSLENSIRYEESLKQFEKQIEQNYKLQSQNEMEKLMKQLQQVQEEKDQIEKSNEREQNRIKNQKKELEGKYREISFEFEKIKQLQNLKDNEINQLKKKIQNMQDDILEYRKRYDDILMKFETIQSEREQQSYRQQDLKNEIELWTQKYQNQDKMYKHSIEDMKQQIENTLKRDYTSEINRLKAQLEVLENNKLVNQNKIRILEEESKKQELLVQELQLELQDCQQALQRIPLLQNSLKAFESENFKLNSDNQNYQQQLKKIKEQGDHQYQQALQKQNQDFQNLEQFFLMICCENERLHNIINELYGQIDHWKQKYSNQEQFYEVQNQESKNQLETNNQKNQELILHLQSQLEQYENSNKQLNSELIQLQNQAQFDQQKALEVQEAEKRIYQINMEYNALLKRIQDKEQESQLLQKQIQEINYEQSNSHYVISNLNNQIQFLKSENERLNKIIMERFKTNYW